MTNSSAIIINHSPSTTISKPLLQNFTFPILTCPKKISAKVFQLHINGKYMQNPLFVDSEILISHKMYCFFCTFCFSYVWDLDKMESEKWTDFILVHLKKRNRQQAKSGSYVDVYFPITFSFLHNLLVRPWLYPISAHSYIYTMRSCWWLAFLCWLKSIYCRRLYTKMTSSVQRIPIVYNKNVLRCF